jgi:peroxiredoxin-like protein
MESYMFEAEARWTLPERGTVQAKHVEPILEFTVPPEFGGEPGLWTPEHLLLASVASCYVATFRGMSEKSNLEFNAITVSVEGVIEKRDGCLCFTKITLRPEAVICREEDLERAGRLLEKAERGCLIARSLSSEFVLQPSITVEAGVTV